MGSTGGFFTALAHGIRNNNRPSLSSLGGDGLAAEESAAPRAGVHPEVVEANIAGVGRWFSPGIHIASA